MLFHPTLDAIELGRAAEHLVVADLILQGIRAFLTEQGVPYDIVAEHAGRLWRVQVKSTSRPRNVNAKGRSPRIAYSWAARRRGKSGEGNRLSPEHCDIVALVALDIRIVSYLTVRECAEMVYMEPRGSVPRQTTNSRSFFGRAMPEYTFERAIACSPR